MRPDTEGSNLKMIDDGIVLVDKEGKIVVADSVDNLRKKADGLSDQFGLHVNEQVDLNGELLPPTHKVMMPVTANTHDHSFQPPGFSGPLIAGESVDGLEGWLPSTLRRGEHVAKGDIQRARRMLEKKYADCVLHGIGATLQFTTSSYDAARAAIEMGNESGLRVVAGYVAMDQNMDFIQPGLQEDNGAALKATEKLLDEFGSECVAVIDRFPIAVSSETRIALAKLARQHGALYETHFDEQAGRGREKHVHKSIYGTSSITRTLLEDEVFESGSRVGLAHSIHTTRREMDKIARKIDAGCEVNIRACPSSNAQLGSQFVSGKWSLFRNRHVRFPFRDWAECGANITLGTDRGAGRTSNVFREMIIEHGRHPIEDRPSYLDVLRYGTVQGLKSLGIDLEEISIREGNPADFVVVELSGSDAYWDHGEHYGDQEFTAALAIDGGQDSSGVESMWVKGKQLK